MLRKIGKDWLIGGLVVIIVILFIILIPLAWFCSKGVIVGSAWENVGATGILVAADPPVKGMRVNVYRVSTLNTEKTEFVTQVTTNENGVYAVRVRPGNYLIEPVLECPGYPGGWSSSSFFKSFNYVFVGFREIRLGPTFLLYRQTTIPP